MYNAQLIRIFMFGKSFYRSIIAGADSETLHSLWFSDMHDAHVVLEAVRLHKLQPVTRRLNEVEVCMELVISLPFQRINTSCL